MLESFGVPLPGETALIAFGILASQGHYSIAEVIAVAAAGIVLALLIGFFVTHRGKKWLENRL